MKITKRTNPNFKFSMIKNKKKAKRKFASQTLSKKAKFVVFGLKKPIWQPCTPTGTSKPPQERDAWCQLLAKWSDSRCRRYVGDLSNVTPRYLGSEQKSRISLLRLTFSSRLASLLLRWKAADAVFVVQSLSFQVWRYSPTVAMSLVSTPSTACQSPSVCMVARSSAYA